eukprot:473301_1
MSSVHNIAVRGNTALYSFTMSIRNKLLQVRTSKNCKKWSFFFKLYGSEIYNYTNGIILNDRILWNVLKGQSGFGSWIMKVVFEPYFQAEDSDDIYESLYNKLIEFDKKNSKNNAQPNASQVAASYNVPQSATGTSAKPKRSRRGGVYKNSVTPEKLRTISRDVLLSTNAGRYTFIAVLLLGIYAIGCGEFIESFGEVAHWCTNININRAARIFFPTWSKAGYSSDKKWKQFFEDSEKGSGIKLFSKSKYPVIFDRINGFMTDDEMSTFYEICNDGFDVVMSRKQENNNNNNSNGNGNGYGPSRGA